MAKGKYNNFKEVFLGFISCLALLVIGWLVFFGKGKISGIISPLINKIPKDESKLTQFTDDVLGKAIEAAKGGRAKQAAQKGAEVFENSQYAEPGREIRDNVKARIDEVMESIKQLPEKELKIIKMEIYKKWFSDIATGSAN